ncbi:MAG: exosortase/archaeosortase family protein [Pirellulales bacterium]|nr:exosortase/archaeosortase family protein [Pirellulales bacterium]
MTLLLYRPRYFILGCILTIGTAAGVFSQETTESPSDSSAVDKSIRQQDIYIPYEKLRRVFEKQGRGVFLPYEKFQELWKAARDKTQPPPALKPPVGEVITETDSDATVEKDVVRVKAKVKIDLLSKGWHEVPLRLGDAAILSAKIADQPARIVGAAGSGYRLLVEKKDQAAESIELFMEYAKAVQRSPGLCSVSFQAPQAPLSRWKVTIPQSGVKVQLRPLIAATEAPTGEEYPVERTVVLAFVGAAPTVQIDWTPKAEGATGLAALASVQAEQQVWLSENVVRSRSVLQYAISRAELPRLTLEVPGDYKIVNVFDPNIRRWTAEAKEGRQTITAELFEPAKQSQQVTVELERYFDGPMKTVVVPIVKALDVGRQQGIVVVKPSADLRCEVGKSVGLLQIDAGELPQALARGGWPLAYRYAAVPYELVLDVEKEQPQILADSLVEASVEPEKLAIDFLTVYTIQRAGVFRLELDVPEGFEVRRVTGVEIAGAKAVQVENHHLEGEKQTRLVVSLARKALGRVALLVELSRDLKQPELLSPLGKAATLQWALPQAAPRSVERATGRLVVYAPESLRVNPGKTTGLRSIAPSEALQFSPLPKGEGTGVRASLPKNGPHPSPLPKGEGTRSGNLQAALAFAYGQEPTEISVLAERKKPQVTVEQQLIVEIDEGVAKYRAVFRYRVRYSGIQELRIDLPEGVAALAHTKTAHEVVTPPPADLPKGYVAWNLRGQGELLGRGEFTIAWEEKVKDLALGKEEKLPVPRLIPQGADIATGQIALIKSETLNLDESGKTEGLTPIDPQTDLQPPVARAARAYKFSGPWKLTVAATQYQLQEVKRTSIERGLVRMVVTAGDTVAVQALYRIRTARDRLAIKLPAGAQFDADPLRVGGKSVMLEVNPNKKDEYFIPIMTPNADAPLLLELRYTRSGDGSRLELPEFPQEPAVLQVYLAVYLPETKALLGVSGPWTKAFHWQLGRYGRWYPVRNPGVPDDLLSWVREDVASEQSAIENFPTDGTRYTFSSLQPKGQAQGALILRMMDAQWLSAWIFLAVAALGVVLTPARLWAKALFVGVTVAGLVVLAVFSPTLAFQILSGIFLAAWFVVAVLWIVWCLGRWSRRACRTAPASAAPGHEAGVDLSQYEPHPPEPPHAEEKPQAPGAEGGPSHE